MTHTIPANRSFVELIRDYPQNLPLLWLIC